MTGLMVVMLMSYSRVVSVVLVLSGVGTVLRRAMGLSYRNYVALQGEHLITQLLRANGRLLLALSTQRMAYPSRK